MLNRMAPSVVAALKKSQTDAKNYNIYLQSALSLWSLYLSSSHAFPTHMQNLEP